MAPRVNPLHKLRRQRLGAHGAIDRQIVARRPRRRQSANDVAPSDLDCVAKMIQKAGIPTFVHRTEAEVIWGKLVRLSAVASLTAAFQEPLGAIRSDPEKRLLLEEAVREAASVASHDGVDIDPRKVIAQIDSFPSRLTTSLQRDIAASHSSEVESITGGVIRLANS